MMETVIWIRIIYKRERKFIKIMEEFDEFGGRILCVKDAIKRSQVIGIFSFKR